MKLTIKQDKQRSTLSEQSQDYDNNIWKYSPLSKTYDKLCSDEDLKRRRVVIRANNQKQRIALDIIKIDIANFFSRICQEYLQNQLSLSQNNWKQQSQYLYEFIYESIQQFRCTYSIGLGFLCTHVYCHCKYSQQRFQIIHEAMKKFMFLLSGEQYQANGMNSTKFDKNQLLNKQRHALQQETLQRVTQYLTSDEDEQTRINPLLVPFENIIQKYQRSLLLQFIPTKYSQYIITEYIKNGIEEYIRLVTSLIHFTMKTRNVINQEHYCQILANPYMGIIQWPIVIANRHNFSFDHKQS